MDVFNTNNSMYKGLRYKEKRQLRRQTLFCIRLYKEDPNISRTAEKSVFI